MMANGKHQEKITSSRDGPASNSIGSSGGGIKTISSTLHRLSMTEFSQGRYRQTGPHGCGLVRCDPLRIILSRRDRRETSPVVGCVAAPTQCSAASRPLLFQDGF